VSLLIALDAERHALTRREATVPDNEIVFCMIAPNDEPIIVTLRATGLIRAAGTFWVLDEDGKTVIENWPLAAGDSGTAERLIARAPTMLHHGWLTWDIEVCSVHGAQDNGAVEVVLIQHGVSCPITKPQRWDLTGLPQCSSGSTIPIRRGVQFHTL
jgi:hypothetical protein